MHVDSWYCNSLLKHFKQIHKVKCLTLRIDRNNNIEVGTCPSSVLPLQVQSASCQTQVGQSVTPVSQAHETHENSRWAFEKHEFL